MDANFYDMVMNFIADHTKAEKPMKTEGGVKFPKSDFAFTPSDKPSTWKLRMSEGRPGNITVKQLGRAAAAFSPGGFRGQKVQIPNNKVSAVKAKLRGAYSKLGVKKADVPDSIKEQSSFTIWKEKDGTYRFLAIYSNNFRDDDSPPEIISEKSHKRFDEMLTKGEVPMPELWLWHVDEWKLGQVTGHAWDDSGFAVAIGTIDKGKEDVAAWLIEQGDNFKTSHGMPREFIVRSPDDETVIVEHITREISPLPAWAAANQLTGFAILPIEKEVQDKMAIPNEKREALLAQGLSAEILESLEEMNAEKAEKALASGLEHKETTEVKEDAEQAKEVQTETVEAETKTETVEKTVETEPETEVKEEIDAITRDEVADAILAAIDPINKALEQIVTLVKSQNAEIEELRKDDSEKLAEKAALTPAASIYDIIQSRRKSVIGNDATKLGKDDELKDKGPKETEYNPQLQSTSPIPFIREMIQMPQRKQ